MSVSHLLRTPGIALVRVGQAIGAADRFVVISTSNKTKISKTTFVRDVVGVGHGQGADDCGRENHFDHPSKFDLRC